MQTSSPAPAPAPLPPVTSTITFGGIRLPIKKPTDVIRFPEED